MILAHIAGIPVEETALSFGPVLAAGGGIAMVKVRERLSRRRSPLRRGYQRRGAAPGSTPSRRPTG
jgi:hypothetical protein